MKNLVKIIMVLFIASGASAQTDSGYVFTTIKDLPATPVKDQYRSGTCWSFSGLSFIESEVLRKGGDTLDLSEMYVVRKCYDYKAEKYIRMHGTINFDAGGAFFDVFWVLDHYGLFPESAYKGLNYGEDKHVHGEVNGALQSFVKSIETNKNKKLSTAWKGAVDGILDAYFGKIPESFVYDGKTTDETDFTHKYVDVDPSDYVSITSFTHHPFYEKFILEIPDNWLWGASYNVPLNEMAEICRYAVENGYTIAWGGDTSEKGFSFKNGMAIIPDADTEDMSDLERAKWENMSQNDRDRKLYTFDKPGSEKKITQEIRQEEFDNYQTTDDHGMHITGMVRDQNGTVYYKVKNSWNTNNIYDGYLYMSEPYLKLKTMNFVVHKDAIPKEIRKKLGIK
ncbi:aminopeptidase C [Saccharicrinis sp. FJH62]|uniref:aminopeptidase C n=1 Tax=Saccharicrinis sp. FJH62 TaxID=3344657 RepID=UPI0035D49CAA